MTYNCDYLTHTTFQIYFTDFQLKGLSVIVSGLEKSKPIRNKENYLSITTQVSSIKYQLLSINLYLPYAITIHKKYIKISNKHQ